MCNDVDEPVIEMFVFAEVTDVFPRTISNISVTPASPTSDDTLNITAIVQDDSAVSSVRINYSKNSDKFLQNMNLSSGDTYNILIPLDFKGNFSFFIEAFDAANNKLVSDIVSVEVLGPDAVISPLEWNIGNVSIGDIVKQNFTLINNGTSLLKGKVIFPRIIEINNKSSFSCINNFFI